jgi:hypothetical protein
MQGIILKLANHPGAVRWPGNVSARPNKDVYQGLLGMPDDELAELGTVGVI